MSGEGERNESNNLRELIGDRAQREGVGLVQRPKANTVIAL